MAKAQPKRSGQDMNLVKLVNQFGSEDKCRAYLEAIRWPDRPICPRCGSVSVSMIPSRHQFECNACRYQFTVTAGTIFHDSHLPLWKWFLTAYMMIEAKKGVSANQVKRTIGVSYKTAWFLCHRIRAAMTEARPGLLQDTVEVDETYIGGRRRGKGSGYKGNKVVVVGIVQRGGKVRLQVAEGTDRHTLHTFILRHTSHRLRRVITDEHVSYQGLSKRGIRHDTINHEQEQYVRGDVHTNSVENVWSLLNRSIMGAYHKVSPKHLDRYLDELEWRFNNRANPYLFRDTILRLCNAKSLPYQKLTREPA